MTLPAMASEIHEAVYLSYHYNTWGESVPSPAGYIPEMSVGRDLGEFGALAAPSDFYVKNRELFDFGQRQQSGDGF